MKRALLFLLIACGGSDVESVQRKQCLATDADCTPCHEGNYRIQNQRYLICDSAGQWVDAGEAP